MTTEVVTVVVREPEVITVRVLEGAPGVAGADGAPGADGADGADGAAGIQGPPGANGTNGTNGTNGSDASVTSANVRAAIPELVTGPGSGTANTVALLDTTGRIVSRSTVIHSSGDIVMPSAGKILFPDRSTSPSNPSSGIQVYGKRLATGFPQRLTWSEVLDNPRQLIPDPFGWLVGQVKAGRSATTTTPSTVLSLDGAIFPQLAFSGGTGTLTHPTQTFNDARRRAPRFALTTNAAAGATATMTNLGNWRGTSNPGFLYLFYHVCLETLVATPQLFAGIRQSGGMSGEPSALVNVAGAFAADSTDAYWHFMHNDGSGTCTRQRVGGASSTDFPLSTSSFFDVGIYSPRASDNVFFYARRGDVFFEYEYTAVTDVPAGSQAVGPYLAARNGTTAAIQDLTMGGIYSLVPREMA